MAPAQGTHLSPWQLGAGLLVVHRDQRANPGEEASPSTQQEGQTLCRGHLHSPCSRAQVRSGGLLHCGRLQVVCLHRLEAQLGAPSSHLTPGSRAGVLWGIFLLGSGGPWAAVLLPPPSIWTENRHHTHVLAAPPRPWGGL